MCGVEAMVRVYDTYPNKHTVYLHSFHRVCKTPTPNKQTAYVLSFHHVYRYDVTALTAPPPPVSHTVTENFGNALGPDPDLPGQNDAFVYDYYSLVGGGGASLLDLGNLYDSAAVVSWDDACDYDDDYDWEGEVMSDIDSDDSNAEGFYANSYPDEDSDEDDDDLSHEGGNFSGGEDDDEVEAKEGEGEGDGECEGGELSSGDDVDQYENAPVAFGRFM